LVILADRVLISFRSVSQHKRPSMEPAFHDLNHEMILKSMLFNGKGKWVNC
jgi:hypothetical protein